MIGIRGIRGATIGLLFGACLILTVAEHASANPWVWAPVATYEGGIAAIFLVNLPIDMLAFSLLFLSIFWWDESSIWRVPTNHNVLVGLIIVAGLAIALLGAVIDFYGLYEYHEAVSVFDKTGYWPALTDENIAVTAAGVFASVYAVSFVVGRMRIIAASIPASVLACLSVIAWKVQEDAILVDQNAMPLLIGIAFLLEPPILFWTIRIHKSRGLST